VTAEPAAPSPGALDDVRRLAGPSATIEPVLSLKGGDCSALARSHDGVTSWVPNYAPLGRPGVDVRELRRRHAQWTRVPLERI
jgi:hypothetical protein